MVSHKKYAQIVGLLGLGLLLAFIWFYGLQLRNTPLRYTIFLLLMTISEFQTIPMNNSYLSMEFGFVYSAIFIFGPISAALMKTLSTLISQISLRVMEDTEDKVNKVFFNVGQYMLSFFLALGVYFLIKKNFVFEHPMYDFLIQGAAIVVYFLTNNLFVEIYVSLEERNFALDKFAVSLLMDITTYVVSIPAGIIIVSIYNMYGFFETSLAIAVYMTAMYVYVMYYNLIGTNRELAALYDVAATITSTLDVEKV
ncbi:MAG: hypothetical protein PHE70_11230, partial [Tepidanaerobacteraceae bacterium]|nr:hypothetical protein [Tepidanaerobacteraceae bacterium]